MNISEFLNLLSAKISAQITNLEAADKEENPDTAVCLRDAVQDRLQEIVIEIESRPEMKEI